VPERGRPTRCGAIVKQPSSGPGTCEGQPETIWPGWDQQRSRSGSARFEADVLRNHPAFIWSVADLLRGDSKQSEYGKVILPMTVLRRSTASSKRRSRRYWSGTRRSQVESTTSMPCYKPWPAPCSTTRPDWDRATPRHDEQRRRQPAGHTRRLYALLASRCSAWWTPEASPAK
jgi:hypothetical protein